MTPGPDLTALTLAKGAHTTRAHGVCLLEAVAWFAGRPHGDHPPCVSPVLAAYGRSLNDYLSDGPRQALVPFVPRMPGTAGDGKDAARMDVLTRWMLDSWAARWLDLAGLGAEAARLRAVRLPGWPAAAAAAAAGDAVAAAAAAAAAAGDAAADAVVADAVADAADAAAAALTRSSAAGWGADKPDQCGCGHRQGCRGWRDGAGWVQRSLHAHADPACQLLEPTLG